MFGRLSSISTDKIAVETLLIQVQDESAVPITPTITAQPSKVSDIRAYLNRSDKEELPAGPPGKAQGSMGRRSRSKRVAMNTADT